MSSIMICIIGEQPVPNLLPVRHCKPSSVVLAYSNTTKRVHDNLVKFFSQKHSELKVESIDIPPYDLVKAYNCFKSKCAEYNRHSKQILFNITGGTKPMSFAGFLVGQDRNYPLLYLDSRGSNILYYYRFRDGTITLDRREEISEVITIREYLQVHGFWECEPRKPRENFEREIAEVLRGCVSCIWCSVELGSIEIDIIVRINNTIGVIQAKTGKKAERIDGIYNLNTVAKSEFLGSRTKRFLITSRPLGTNNKRLAEQQGIKIIELLSYESKGTLSDSDKELLRKEVVGELSK